MKQVGEHDWNSKKVFHNLHLENNQNQEQKEKMKTKSNIEKRDKKEFRFVNEETERR